MIRRGGLKSSGRPPGESVREAKRAGFYSPLGVSDSYSARLEARLYVSQDG